MIIELIRFAAESLHNTIVIAVLLSLAGYILVSIAGAFKPIHIQFIEHKINEQNIGEKDAD